jgi:hypothetical protein
LTWDVKIVAHVEAIRIACWFEGAFPERSSGPNPAYQFSLARYALLDNGRLILLEDGRGWAAAPMGDAVIDFWANTTAADLEQEAQHVALIEEPEPSELTPDNVPEHWRSEAQLLAKHGVTVTPFELATAPVQVRLANNIRSLLRDHSRAPVS